ncbi:uncharacterized protein [Procambarus clarkii]|uniref:uncharacterized protein n=1 Tax=Procambarus clarkii TaxID=6728 RepID=UPI00374455CC
MPLQSWASNNKQLNQIIEEEFPDYRVPHKLKVLGMEWNTSTDKLNIKSVEINHSPLTMRKLLSHVSKPFDPLGLLSLFLIKGKLLMQECWQRNLRWDEALPEDLQEKWQQLIPDYNKLSILQFPRNTLGQNLPTNLHVFCDASGKAYSSVAYLVNTQQSFLLTSKGRVVPIERRSLPQMELTALLVGVRLAPCLIKTLSNVHLGEIVVWSDNEAVLQWVKNDIKTLYVSNRVREIRELSAGYKLRHVPTKDNPTDYLSRGLTLKQLVKIEMWFNGPQWLVSGQWPQQKSQIIVTNITTPVVDPEPTRTLAINPHHYSNLSKLLRVTEMVFDFINKMGIKYRFPSSIKY